MFCRYYIIRAVKDANANRSKTMTDDYDNGPELDMDFDDYYPEGIED
jgi:hypothetical protein